ncbi:MAG: class I SAM-dependent methyltransferase [Nitrospirae bacterium]|nr:class I SAM-dependent methyltransferase [Nitrospirota bacterium]MBF0590829.1 class I SAM-dependent methyltransferase [Nitrospirota bacterium]
MNKRVVPVYSEYLTINEPALRIISPWRMPDGDELFVNGVIYSNEELSRGWVSTETGSELTIKDYAGPQLDKTSYCYIKEFFCTLKNYYLERQIISSGWYQFVLNLHFIFGDTIYDYDVILDDKYEVLKDISPNDLMFHNDIDRYLSVGDSALRSINIGLIAARKVSVNKILDMPCGHGRVLRTLKSAFPDALITACDLDRDAVDFCTKYFSAIPLYSKEIIEQIRIKDKYDLIWCGSLFTHLDSKRWDSLLNLFSSSLETGGILVFTVHGIHAVHLIRNCNRDFGLEPFKLPEMLEEFDNSGFAYLDYPGAANWGISLSSPTWVMSQLQKIRQLQVVMFTEIGWTHFQDVIVCTKLKLP